MIETVILDIDGTIAENKVRLGEYLADNKDWEKFYAAAEYDTPVLSIITIVKALQKEGYPIVVVTGRPERFRKITHDWVSEQGIKYVDMYMREDEDYHKDYEYKEEVYNKLMAQGVKILCVFEDRTSVVRMWRDMGLTCLQVRDGDY